MAQEGRNSLGVIRQNCAVNCIIYKYRSGDSEFTSKKMYHIKIDLSDASLNWYFIDARQSNAKNGSLRITRKALLGGSLP